MPWNTVTPIEEINRFVRLAATGRFTFAELGVDFKVSRMLNGIRCILQLLGHAMFETTAIYTEVIIRQLIEVHVRCHPSGQLGLEPVERLPNTEKIACSPP